MNNQLVKINAIMIRLFVVFIMALFFTFCSSENVNDKSEKIIPVTVADVIESEINIPILTSGKISSQAETKLSFKTGGIIAVINVNEGQYVKKGSILAKIDLSEINAKVDQAKSGYQKAERDYIRVESLYKDSVVTLEQFQNIKTSLDVAKSNYDIAKFNQDYSTIIAPSNGRILKKFVESNEIVGPGTPILLFGSKKDGWKIKTGLTDKDIYKIKLGDSANIVLDAIPKEKFSASITEIAGDVNPYNSTYEVELTVKSSNKKIISGMVGKIKIFPKSIGKYKTIPIKCLVNANELRGEVFAFSIADSTIKKVNVEINDIIDEYVVINKGLEDVNTVILDGVEYVTEGAKVKIVTIAKHISGDVK
jgi:membrane fusion protein, multidrug efflux system